MSIHIPKIAYFIALRNINSVNSDMDDPNYSLAEASIYLKIPQPTLRTWFKRRTSSSAKGDRYFRPLLKLPNKNLHLLSISTSAIVNRIDAGETMEYVADDYGLDLVEVQLAMRYEKRLAA